MRLAQDFHANPPEATATEPHEQLYYQLPIATSPPMMGDRLTLPVYDGRSSSRSVSERSARSDSSPERSETSHRSSTRSGITSKEKRKRASRPKVKTGCINCKRRHVKCDEGKPNCSKCESLGLDCEGYAPPKAPRPVLRTDRMLLPMPKPTAVASRPSARRYQSAGARVPLLAQPRLDFDGSSDDGWYFSLFRVQVAHDLSSDHRHNFWSRPSLRDSMTIRSIRHSVLSIGAYARALLDLKSDYPFLQSADRPWWPRSIVNRHHQAALDHHSKALSYLRQEIATNGVDSQTTMAANLLFIVFENMQGNYHSAGNLVRSGIKYLNQLDRDTTNTFKWRTYNEASNQPGEIDEMARLFSQHSVASVNIPFPHCKNAYHLLLDHSNSSASSFDDMDSFPLEFPAGDLVPHSFEQALTIWDGIIHSLARFTTYSMWINLNPHYSPDMDVMRGHQEQFITRLFEFGAGLALLTAERPGDMEARGLAYLGIHHLVATVMVSSCLDRSEVIYDDFQPEFEEILRRIHHYLGLAGVGNRTGFANEVGVLPLIAFVAAKCRAPAPRTEAVALLRRHPWREGPWDGVSLARAMQELMRLEGQSPDDDDDDDDAGRAEDTSSSSPSLAEARFTWTNMFWDFENHRMTAEYTKIMAKPGDKPEARTVVMSPE